MEMDLTGRGQIIINDLRNKVKELPLSVAANLLRSAFRSAVALKDINPEALAYLTDTQVFQRAEPYQAEFTSGVTYIIGHIIGLADLGKNFKDEDDFLNACGLPVNPNASENPNKSTYSMTKRNIGE